MSQVCGSDGSFGPTVGACRGGFDFTLTFEESVLGLLPQALLLLLAPLRLMTLRHRRERIAKNTHLGFLKLVVSTLYAASSTLLLALWAQADSYKTKTSIASACFEFLSSWCIVLLSRQEHSRAVRPSHLLQFFLLVLFLCDTVRLRTLFLMQYDPALVSSASVHTALTGILLLLESMSKKDLLVSENDRRLSPEETIGLFGQRLFWYLNDLFKEGYRRVLRPQDLHRIDNELVSDELHERFQRKWRNPNKQASDHALLWTICSVLRNDVFLPVLPRILYMGTTLAQPFLISTMVNYIQKPVSSTTNSQGYGLVAAFALNYFFLAVASSWYSQSVARFSVKLRSVLITAIYDKALSITSQEVNLGSATVLMNVDVEKVIEGVERIHDIWAVAVSSGIALYILYTKLGAALVAPLLVVLFSTLLSSGIGGNVKKRQLDWVARTERRVTTIANVASSAKGIRMLGLAEAVHRMATALRVEEVAAHRYVRKLLTWVFVVSNLIFQISLFSTYITFAVMALYSGDFLDYDSLFTSLSALKLVTSPMLSVLQQIPHFQSAAASLDRIQDYLVDLNETEVARDDPVDARSCRDVELRSVRHRTKPSKAFQAFYASFGIDRMQALLHRITLDIDEGSLTMVVGKVASGKSVLLQSLVGETTVLSGRLDTNGAGVSFCAQSPWLRNATLRENILGESEFDQGWYDTVTWACGLKRDFKELNNQDAAMVGSRGITLSGGQKNRVSLARALYARKPVLVVDDVLSGLDNTTESLVFSRVFGKDGLLRKMNCTVVLATHSVRWAPHSDMLIVLSEGCIVADGPYADLVKEPGFLETHSLHSHGKDSLTGSEVDKDGHEETAEEEIPSPAAAIAEVEAESGYNRRSGDFGTLLYYHKAIGNKHIAVDVLLLAIANAMNALQYVWLKELAKDSESADSLRKSMGTFTAITIVDVFFVSIAIAHFTMVFCPRSSLSLHAQQLAAFTQAKYSFLVVTDVGAITNRFSQDIVLVDNVLTMAWVNTIYGLFQQLANFGILVAATPPVAALVPFLAAIGYLIQRVYLRTSRQIRLMDLEAKAPLCTNFLETLAGIVTIRAFGWSDAFRDRNKRLLDDSQVPFYLLQAIQNWLRLVLELMVAGLVVVLVGLAVALRSKMDAGYLGLALVGAMDLGVSISGLVTAWTELETALSAVARIRLFSTNTPQEPSPSSLPSPAVVSEQNDWPAHGAITFRNLSAAYSSEDQAPPVLCNINLQIAPGEKIGICGRTGSGKSSLVAALFGMLHQVPHGQILIDGIPTDGMPLSVLRAGMVALPQEPFFLGKSVREDLAPWAMTTQGDDGKEVGDKGMMVDRRPRPSDAEMVHALRRCQLWAKLEAAAPPDGSGLDVRLENVDGLLSQGEKQLFCLARAVLQPGRIVVLDEATSSVDAATDALMQEIIHSAFAERTIIAIAHRLHTILSFDRVVVLERGEVVEVGPPQALLKTEGSMFKALMNAQGQGKMKE